MDQNRDAHGDRVGTADNGVDQAGNPVLRPPL